ncbi:cell surface glycoprotein CD200 receptor 1-B-like [Alligator sinensis]|uniref:Cell surface glycoprotein CD200 receptor 1-B-like n=1 Tax=Alligator sinensis TaxID=38654 RepID=A0A1U8CXI6_ALLSI|nr:cell surface glycoprotein CD200 receptor 1-B-like [Alligator sinensis]
MRSVGKRHFAFLLLIIARSAVLPGCQASSSTEPKTQLSEENNSSPQKKQETWCTHSITTENISGSAGSRVLLTCPSPSWESLVTVTWKIRPRKGAHCSLYYREDTHTVGRTACIERLNWKPEPEQNFTLQLSSVELTDEGLYICEIVSSDGNFDRCYHLTVLVPPKVTLNCDNNGSVVCKAAAGKPAAQMSWVPEIHHSGKNESHPSGTVTVLSKYVANPTRDSQVTCSISHPTGNWSQSIDCHSERSHFCLRWILILSGLLSLLLVLAFIELCLPYDGRFCHRSQTLATGPPDSTSAETAI